MKNMVEFAGHKCKAVLDYYDPDMELRPRIRLYDYQTGEPVATATVNIPSYEEVDPDSAFIKDYSENKGMLEALVKAGIVLSDKDGPAILDEVKSGFVTIPLVQLNREWTEQFDLFAGMTENEVTGS